MISNSSNAHANNFVPCQQQNQLPQLHPQLQPQQPQPQSQSININTNSSFTPYPTPATATTDVSKDLAFSTNSSSSTLYQDAESQFNNSSGNHNSNSNFNNVEITHGFNNSSTNGPNHFISASAPVPSHQFPSSMPMPSFHQFNNQRTSMLNGSNNNNSNLNAPNGDQYINHAPLKPPQSAGQQQQPHVSDTEEHLNIAEYPVQELLLMLSALLQKIVEANDLLHTEEDHMNKNQNCSSNTGMRSNSNNHVTNHNGSNTSFDKSNGAGLLNSKYSANVLAFHGRNIPAISLHAYLTRILKYCPVTNDVFLSLLVYFDRIAKRANNTEKTSEDAIMMGDDDNNIDNNIGDNIDVSNTGNIDQADFQAQTSNFQNTESNDESPQVFVMDSYNIHRLIISGITVASKFFSDVFYKNSRYAKVGGLPLDELNHLELQFLLLLDFHLMIQKEELERYGDLLLRFWKREQIKRISISGAEHQPMAAVPDSDNVMPDQ